MTVSFFPKKEDALAYRREIETHPDVSLHKLARGLIPIKVQFTCEARSGVCGIRRMDHKPLKCGNIGYVRRMTAKDMKMCGLRRVK